MYFLSKLLLYFYGIFEINFLFSAVKQNNKNLKAARKNGKQKKMKRKWAGAADKGSKASPGNSGTQEQVRGRIHRYTWQMAAACSWISVLPSVTGHKVRVAGREVPSHHVGLHVLPHAGAAQPLVASVLRLWPRIHTQSP